MHVRDRSFRVVGRAVEDVRDPAIRHELLVHRHLQFVYGPVSAEDFAQVRRVHVLRELLDHDFRGAWCAGAATSGGRTRARVGA